MEVPNVDEEDDRTQKKYYTHQILFDINLKERKIKDWNSKLTFYFKAIELKTMQNTNKTSLRQCTRDTRMFAMDARKMRGAMQVHRNRVKKDCHSYFPLETNLKYSSLLILLLALKNYSSHYLFLTCEKLTMPKFMRNFPVMLFGSRDLMF